MNKEVIKNIITSTIQEEKHLGDNLKKQCIDYIEVLEQENKILRKNAESNDKVVDKVNWDNRLLKQALNEIREYINRTNKEEGLLQNIDTGKKINTILQIIDKVLGDDSNENK